MAQPALGPGSFSPVSRRTAPLLFLAPIAGDRVVTGFPIRAIILPQVHGGPETELVPASPARALLALAPHAAGLNALATLT
jgi:hypothetical protein